MKKNSFTFRAMVGSLRRAMAMLVIGAISTRVISPGFELTVSTIASTACLLSGRCRAFGKKEFPIPSLPWMYSTVVHSRRSGCRAPGYTGTFPDIPANSTV